MKKFETFADAYAYHLDILINSPMYVTEPRGMKIHEICNAQIQILDPTSVLFRNHRRDLPLDYLAKELCLYLSATNQLNDFEKASSFWKKIANPDGTINSAYGNLIFNSDDRDYNGNITQFDWAREMLTNDKDSRQSILHFNRAYHCNFNNTDFPCTLYGIFHIRDNKLNFKISMRSNDIFLGITFDVPFFCVLQMIMLSALRPIYPDLQLGSYTHCADSLHLYEKNFEIANEMNSSVFYPYKIPMPSVNLIKNPIFIKILNSECSLHDYAMMDKFTHWVYTSRNL